MREHLAGIADSSAFPWKLWSRLQTRAMKELGRSSLFFADPRGLPELRQAVARYLAQFRGIRCSPAQVVVFNSAQQALNALAVLLLDRGDPVWIEDPGYLGARAAFGIAGADVIPVPVDDEGMRVDVGIRRAPVARLVYTTPPHQYPTGVSLSLERRIALLEWAARNRAWIVEDDYDGEFRHSGQPLAALHSLDSHARVLYLGTLNKAMFVSLRLAYLIVPETLVEPLANIRTQMDGFTPAVAQKTMSLFMDEGYFSSHLRRMRGIYAEKRAALVAGMAPLISQGWTWSNNPVGMHLLVRHRDGECPRSSGGEYAGPRTTQCLPPRAKGRRRTLPALRGTRRDGPKGGRHFAGRNRLALQALRCAHRTLVSASRKRPMQRGERALPVSIGISRREISKLGVLSRPAKGPPCAAASALAPTRRPGCLAEAARHDARRIARPFGLAIFCSGSMGEPAHRGRLELRPELYRDSGHSHSRVRRTDVTHRLRLRKRLTHPRSSGMGTEAKSSLCRDMTTAPGTRDGRCQWPRDSGAGRQSRPSARFAPRPAADSRLRCCPQRDGTSRRRPRR